MSTSVVMELPDQLAAEIIQEQEHVAAMLERGLRELRMERESSASEIAEIMATLASQPSPETVLALQPSTQMQAKVSELLAKSKSGQLSRQEEVELERYLTIEHLVRLAKGHAYQQLAQHTSSS